jgi:hypothetical protein
LADSASLFGRRRSQVRQRQDISGPGGALTPRGANDSAAYADIDSGVAVAVMRNRFDADPTAVTAIDRIVKEET